MATREHRTPLSIKIVIGIFGLLLVGKVAGLLAFVLGKPLHQPWPEFILMAFLLSFQLVALSRMSRWPVIVQVVTVTSSITLQYATNPHWTDRYPILGVFAVIVPLMIYLALIVPHWRNMNWALFGRSYRPPQDQAEVFA